MPFVLIPGVGDLAFGLLVVMLGVAAYLITRALAATVGRLPWPIGAALSDAISIATSNVAGWIMSGYSYAFPRVSSWIRGHAYLETTLANGTVSAVSHLGDQIAHHNNTTIPNGDSSTLSSANSHSDTINTNLSSRINQSINDENSDIAAVNNSISSLHYYVDTAFRSALENEINAAEVSAKTQATNDLNTAVNNIVSRITQDEVVLNNLDVLATSTLPAEIQQALSTAENAASTQLASSVASLTARLNDLQTQISDNATAESVALTNAQNAIAAQQALDLSTAEGVADSQAQAALATAQMAIAATAAQETAALQSEASSVAGQLKDINDKQTIDEANIGTVTGIATVAIPLSIAAVSSAVQAITTEFEQCAVVTCGGPNNWQNLLQDVLGVASIAEIGVFLAQAMNDPKGEASALASVAGDTYNAGHALLDSLLSL